MKTTAEMIAEHTARYSPQSFWMHEVAGAARPTLIPRQPSPPAHPEPPAAPRRPEPGVMTMTTETISHADLDQAYAELSAATGVPESLIRDGALELAVGSDASGNTTFSSLADEVQAVSFLAATFGIGSGADMPGTGVELSDVDSFTAGGNDYAAAEIARLALVATDKITGRDGRVHDRYLIDPVLAERGLLPRNPDRPELPPGEAQMTSDQAAEVDRLLSLSQTGTRKASYPAVASRRDRDRGTNAELAATKVNRYLELAEDGSTKTYTSNEGSVTVTEYDATEESGTTYDQAEITRYLNMVAEQMGQAPLVNDPGNRSYAPGPDSEWGQRTRPGAPWFSG